MLLIIKVSSLNSFRQMFSLVGGLMVLKLCSQKSMTYLRIIALILIALQDLSRNFP